MRAILFGFIIIPLIVNSQNKRGHSWLFGINGQIAKFVGDSTRPTTNQLFWNGSSPNYPYIFGNGHSNICDSAIGNIIMLCNGMQLFDSLGNIIEGGDSLVPNNIYAQNTYPNAATTQSSLILPKGNNGEYYVFIATASDTTYDKWLSPTSTITPYDMLLYNIVDINANAGAGKVVKKNMPLLTNTEMSRTMMQACRHSNGIDWWLLKKTTIESNIIIRFLVTVDSIYGPYTQTFSEPYCSLYDATGQSAFNNAGTKYTQVQGKSNKIFLADFNRCTGELNNPIIYNTPIDSTTFPYLDNMGSRDSISNGVCFSPNDQFLYLTKRWNVYQLEINEPDSALAWYHVKHGPDTTLNDFEYYGHLSRGPDKRIYIGKIGGSFKQLSVIDKPDEKGAACNFCRKCLRIDNGAGGSTSPPNMPDYNLGPDTTSPCWPLSVHNILAQREEIEVYPNPSHTRMNIRLVNIRNKHPLIELYNAVGQKVLATRSLEIDVSGLSSGVYYLKARLCSPQEVEASSPQGVRNVVRKIVVD
ncbi:MAG: T9SS type A sorting domain-containing protein [Chitinophagaceae bacterium]|nr:T9SS type A sorting domain-containing protein [Chitinophagaceae bacterium]